MVGPKLLEVDELEVLVDKYFADCKEDEEPTTITGLSIALGFSSRQSIYDYEKRPAYKHVVARAKLMVEHGYEKQVAKGRGDGGIVFILKNMGWSDKQEIEHSEKVTDDGANEW